MISAYLIMVLHGISSIALDVFWESEFTTLGEFPVNDGVSVIVIVSSILYIKGV